MKWSEFNMNAWKWVNSNTSRHYNVLCVEWWAEKKLLLWFCKKKEIEKSLFIKVYSDILLNYVGKKQQQKNTYKSACACVYCVYTVYIYIWVEDETSHFCKSDFIYIQSILDASKVCTLMFQITVVKSENKIWVK